MKQDYTHSPTSHCTEISSAMELEVFQNILNTMDTGIALISKDYKQLYTNKALNSLLSSRQLTSNGEKIYSRKNLPLTLLLQIHQNLRCEGSWQGVFPDIGPGLKVTISPVNFKIPTTLTHLTDACFMLSVTNHSAFLAKQRELIQAESLADRSEKAKSEFLSHMSHELRTPLNAILGFTQLLKIETDLSELQQDNLNEILSASGHLLKLINEILDLSTNDNKELTFYNEQIEIGDLISECISLTNPLALKSAIEILQPRTRLTFSNDRVRLKQVIINLLTNAIKYNNDSGKILIQAFATGNSSLRIEIQDSGKGIPLQFLDTIFEPFALLDASESSIKNRGIGLMITRRLVHHMKGKVSAISLPGSGSVFSLDFPVETHNLNKEDVRAFQKTRKILWIGENSATQQYVSQLCSLRPKLEFHNVVDLSSASALAEDLQPDLIFVPVDASNAQAPNPSLETKLLLKKFPSIAVIKDRVYFKELSSEGLEFSSFLTMPLNTIDFLKIIDDHLFRVTHGTT